MKFSLSRSGVALYHEFYLQWSKVLLSALAVSGTAMIVSLLSWIGGNPASPDMARQYPVFLVIWGAISTSGVFAELREDPFRMELLLRPASAAEKTVAKLLISLVGYFLLFTVVYFVVNALLYLTYTLLFAAPATPRLLPLPLIWESLKAYLLVHSWFFLGAVYFRSHNAFKTLLVLASVGVSYALITAGVVRLLYAPYIVGDRSAVLEQQFGSVGSLADLPSSIRGTVETARILGRSLLVASVPALWLLAIRRLRETEA